MLVNTESQVLNVPIEDIIPNRFQPRLNFDEDGLKELAASIKEHGIIQPLVLRRLGDKYEIIAGERRYKASKIAGLTSVPAIISAMDDQKSAEVAIVENIQRRDLSSIEEAKSYKALLDKGYLTQEELAKKMGLSQSAISNKLRLLSLTPAVQDALMQGKISERHARSLLQVSDLKEQEEWLKKIINERITVRDLEKRLKGEYDSKEAKELQLVEAIPNIEEIKAKAEDINTSVMAPLENIEYSSSSSPIIPNKFFNYLEDESANMSVIEPEAIKEDDIELLDFEIPIINNEVLKAKDMSKAEEIISKLDDELKNNNYKVKITKDETTSQLSYTIVIDKEQ